ncbi:hypothetical protein FRC11_001788 [Ceratobasidium sp. 423]|nr:hypothetical protein FRC11_001788 [Ceratobasidium sp. 423]
MLSIGYRLVGLIRNPKQNRDAISDAKYYIVTGSLMFILAFGIWNVDNTFCDFWTLARTRLWGDEVGPSFRTPSLSAAIVGAVTQGHAIGIVPSVRRSPEFERPEAEEYLLGDGLIVSVQGY